MKENFKDIEGYKGLYQVSNMGRVRSLDRCVKSYGGGLREIKGKKITPCYNGKGYTYARLYINSQSRDYKIYRLVYLTFNNLPLDTPLCVCHKNDIRDDNRLENLFLGTVKDNAQDCLKKRRWADTRGEKNGISKLTNTQVKLIKLQLSMGETGVFIARHWGITKTIISRIKTGQTWAHIF